MFSFGRKSKADQPSDRDRGRLALRRSELAIDRLLRFRLFSGDDYIKHNDDIGSVSPAMHFVGWGAEGARFGATPVHICRAIGECMDGTPGRLSSEKLGTADVSLTVGVYASTFGSAITRKLAEGIVAILRTGGHQVVLGNENSNIEARPNQCIYLAPHEFFFLGCGPSWVRDDVLSTACMYCTERAESSSFWQSLPLVLMARSVVDISSPLATAFSEVMPAACILPSIPSAGQSELPDVENHPLLRGQKWWGAGENQGRPGARPLDLCFFGTLTANRSRFFSRHSERLSRYENFIYLRTKKAKFELNTDSDQAGLIDVAQYVASNSTLLLNIHRDEFPYFDWHRFIHQGIGNGCAVVSERCFSNPDLVPGVHYFEEDAQHLIGLVEWLLNDVEGRDRIAQVALAALAVAQDHNNDVKKANILAQVLTV